MHSQRRRKPVSQKALSEFEPGEKHVYKEKLKKQEKLKWKELIDDFQCEGSRRRDNDQS